MSMVESQISHFFPIHYYLSLNKKTAPGIPETVLKEPKLS